MKDILEEIKCLCEQVREYETGYSAQDIVNLVETIINKHLENQSNKTVYERVKEERDELKEKLDKLNAFIDRLNDGTAKVSSTQWELLASQEEYMRDYLDILEERLEDFEQAEKEGR